MKSLLHPTYFPDIISFAVLAQRKVVWEIQDNFQKQTYRNRCYICTDQGRLMLTIPIKHIGAHEGRQKYQDVRIDNEYPWQRQHWRSIETAYRTSPFFEYYEDDLIHLFENPSPFLLEHNLATITTICNCLEIDNPIEKTTTYAIAPSKEVDLRFLAKAKSEPKLKTPIYNQVFQERHGFIENCSILDILFNLGPAAKAYLSALSLSFQDV